MHNNTSCFPYNPSKCTFTWKSFMFVWFKYTNDKHEERHKQPQQREYAIRFYLYCRGCAVQYRKHFLCTFAYCIKQFKHLDRQCNLTPLLMVLCNSKYIVQTFLIKKFWYSKNFCVIQVCAHMHYIKEYQNMKSLVYQQLHYSALIVQLLLDE
jgi:hypothetical protein